MGKEYYLTGLYNQHLKIGHPNILNLHFFKGEHNMVTIINMYLPFRKKLNIINLCHRNHIQVKKINYLLKK